MHTLKHKNRVLQAVLLSLAVSSLVWLGCHPSKDKPGLSKDVTISLDAPLESEASLYKLSIDGRLTYYFEDMDQVSSALEQVLNSSLAKDVSCEVEITEDLQPLISYKTPETASRQANRKAASVSSTLRFSSDASTVEEFVEPQEPIPSSSLEDIDFIETIRIESVTKDKQTLTTPEHVAQDLLKENVEPDSYTVEAGDSPSTIASSKDMSLDELYALNEGLEEEATSLQIGDALVVEKLVPELSVLVTSRETYTASIPKETIYQDDDSLYVGLSGLGDEGFDGAKAVTAEIKRANGEEISRFIVSEEVILPPQNKIILVGTKAIPDKGSVGFYKKPLKNYRITSLFGSRWGSVHKGIDMATPSGSNVLAADGGVVTEAGWHGTYGYMVEITHGNGEKTRYAHNSQLTVEVGQVVGQQQVIAYSGNTGNSTGPHVHFELIINNVHVNPFDYFID